MAITEARARGAPIQNNTKTLMDIDQQYIAALERQVGDQALSPLFAKLAYLYLESGRAKDALRVCDAGLANFPFYSTGHLIKGKSLLHLGMNGEARREFEFVRDWLPTNPTVLQLLESVPQSDDLVLEAPLSDDPSAEGASTDTMEALTEAPSEESGGSDFFTAATTEDAPETVEPANDFGLPSDVPAADGAFAEENAVTEGPEAGMEAFSQFGQQEPGPTIEDDFDIYAQRKRGELGETGVSTLEEYLSSPPVESAETAEPSIAEPEAAAEDPLAAAGFGQSDDFGSDTPQIAEEEPSPEAISTDEDPFAAAGFGMGEEAVSDGTESEASEEPPPFAGFGVPEEPAGVTEETVGSADATGMEAFGFEGDEPTRPDHEALSEAPAVDAEPTEASGMDAFGFGGAAPEMTEEPQSEEPAPADISEHEVFAGFAGPDEATSADSPAEAEVSQTEETEEPAFPDFSGLAPAEEPPDTQTESPEEGGSAQEDGFSGPPAEEPAAPAPREDKIGAFAEKLQDAKKITPVIDLTAQFSSSASSADEVAADAGFVTPTLAEIYAKQGWYDDAINAYKTLAKSRPAEKDKYEARVKELEEEKAKAD